MEIYKVTNLINNKIYIGKIKKDYPEYFGSGILINRSIKKYGIENFKKEIIDTAFSVEELNEKEKYWIQHFNSNDLKIGYNIGNGGDGGDVFTNNPNKEEIRIKCSKPGEKNGMFGRNHTDESIKKMSENRKGKRKGISTWNKGLKKEDYSSDYKNKIEHPQRKFITKTKKTYIIISPDKKIYENYGELKKFCEKNNLPFSTFRKYIDKGIICQPPKNLNYREKRKNLTGWEIRSLKYHKTIDPKFFPLYIRLKMSESAKKRKGKASIETREKIGMILKQRNGGENNINAKTFYLISPQNEKFTVKGQLPTFCKEHNINLNVIRKWLDSGKIPPSNRINTISRNNTNGWEIKSS